MSQQLPENSDSQQPDANSRQQADSSTPQNVVQGNQNRVVQGDDNKAVLGESNTVIQGNNNLMLTIKELILGQQTTTPVGNPARPKNERILLAAVKEEVTARLRQSLHNAVLINLGKESQPQQVKRPWDAEIKIGLKPAVPLPDTTTTLEVFDSEEIAGKLLILGAPGAGKTTTQLELAQALVKRAEEQPDYPVPVLFNLSSWKDDRQPIITDWLVAELKSKYGVSKNLGQEWVDNHQLLPLLDGLDELEPQRQELCVHAINQFLAGETRPLYLVVCSRSEEYTNYSTQLHLNGAIYLQPLTNNQICDYLTSINYIKLWSTISNDLDLLELVKIPLILSITVLASQEICVEEWQHLNSTADRIQYLLDAYVGRMLTRDVVSRAYLKNKTPNAKKTRMWLVWLAQQMQKEAKTEFLIEEMQPYWLNNKSQILKYRLISGQISGRNVEEMYIIIIEKRNFHIGIKSTLIERNRMIWSPIWSMIVVIFALISALISWLISGQTFGLIDKLNIAMIIFLIGMTLNQISWEAYLSIDPTIENKKITNQGIWKSASNAVFYGLIFGLISGLIFGLIFGLISGLISGLIFGLIFGWNFGGDACIKHFSLRLVLYCDGYIPWNYARFLDYSTERLFLQRVGGRYRFIHKLLQDHFAQMEFKRD